MRHFPGFDVANEFAWINPERRSRWKDQASPSLPMHNGRKPWDRARQSLVFGHDDERISAFYPANARTRLLPWPFGWVGP